MGKIEFRRARSVDAASIARIHIESWRYAYRGILSDSFLDGAIEHERSSLWSKRLADPPSDSLFVQLAEKDDRLVGFICAILDHDPKWGALIDNLHVHPDVQGLGLGRALMKDAASWIAGKDPSSGMYLWVYRENVKARGFYERIGGAAVEYKSERQPDGHDVDIVRYSWRPPAGII